jgi:hypothetical protein
MDIAELVSEDHLVATLLVGELNSARFGQAYVSLLSHLGPWAPCRQPHGMQAHRSAARSPPDAHDRGADCEAGLKSDAIARTHQIASDVTEREAACPRS